MEEILQYGIWKNRLPFHSIAYPSLRKKNQTKIILKTGRFDNIKSVVIIISVLLTLLRTALLTLLMMTANSMLLERPVLYITAAIFFLLKFCNKF